MVIYGEIELPNDVDWILCYGTCGMRFMTQFSAVFILGSHGWTHWMAMCRASAFYIYILFLQSSFGYYIAGWVERLGWTSKGGSHCVSFLGFNILYSSFALVVMYFFLYLNHIVLRF